MASYTGTHGRLIRQRGPASDSRCVAHPDDHYGDRWGYTHLADVELTQVRVSYGSYPYLNRYPYPVPYSEDIFHDYVSICTAEETRLDAIHKNAASTITGDEDDSGAWLL